MYQKILVALENSRADEALLPHIAQLAILLKSELLLFHVADGWVARNFETLKLAESEEMKGDRDYLNRVANRLRAEGLKVSLRLGMGDPASEILKASAAGECDLIAMTSHGHRLLGDLLHGSTIDRVRHRSVVPLLVVSAMEKTPPPARE